MDINTGRVGKTLAKTISLCPACLKRLPAEIIEIENKIYLKRYCIEHGEYSQNISNHPTYYKGLRDYYFNVISDNFKQIRYLLFITGKCNLACPVCFYGEGDFNEMLLSDVEAIARRHKGAEMVIFGKEPTCHEQLPEIVKLLKKTQNSASLYTNGVRIGDRDYLRKLKQSRVNKIYLQFDGFKEDIYSNLRNVEMLGVKLKALDNLRDEKLSTVINMTLVKDNEEEIKKIINYAVKNDFVKTINFTSFIRSGSGRKFLPDCSVMPDEVIDIIEKQTAGVIARDNVYLFQKFLYAYMSFLGKRTCLYIQYYWIYRTKDKYLPIDKLIDLKGMNKILDRYAELLPRNAVLAKLYLVIFLPKYIVNFKSMHLVIDFLKTVCSHLLKLGEYSNMSSKFVQLIFSTACDPYKADFQIAKRCHIGIIYKDNQGVIRKNDENGTYLLTNEIETGVKK
ncbi:MAG: radical SAM protein [Candidatus Omnitrophica bacterium]|nr:radical SAM protein [Candidatus Omnitrophota bacterium]